MNHCAAHRARPPAHHRTGGTGQSNDERAPQPQTPSPPHNSKPKGTPMRYPEPAQRVVGAPIIFVAPIELRHSHIRHSDFPAPSPLRTQDSGLSTQHSALLHPPSRAPARIEPAHPSNLPKNVPKSPRMSQIQQRTSRAPAQIEPTAPPVGLLEDRRRGRAAGDQPGRVTAARSFLA
jgi:hypothetical protein